MSGHDVYGQAKIFIVSPTDWIFSCGFMICFAFSHEGALHVKTQSVRAIVAAQD